MKRAAVSSILVAVVLLTLGVTAEARMNVPGRAEGNWSWSCTEEMMSAADFDSLRELTKSSNRQGTLRRYDYFLKTVFNYPILTECYKVAAYNAANKLASVRHAARAADPSVPAEPSAPVVVAGR
jgi:hypothetical protein